MREGSEGRAGPLGPPGLSEDVYAGVRSTGATSGRALPRRKALPHGVPEWVKAGEVFFVTICCARRVDNELCRAEVSNVLFEAIQFRQTRGDWHVHLLILMPDHLHMLVSFPRDVDMKKVIANFKELTAKKAGVEWQRDYFDHRLRSDESFDEKAHYIRMNPVRKGLVSRNEDWPYMWMPSNGAAVPAVPPYL
jgi:putative transposase